MIVLDRRRVMGAQQDKYIEDGLIFWLDGINKGGDPAAWTDLVYGAKFPYNDTVVLNEDNVDFIYNTRVLNASQVYPAPITQVDTCTIEVVCKYPYTTGLIYYSPSSLAFGILDGRSILPNKTIFANKENDSKKIYSFSIAGAIRAFQNGFLLARTSNENWAGGANYAQLGGRQNTNTLFRGQLYCIRIYTRLLEEEEVKYNFEVDKKRFNIK